VTRTIWLTSDQGVFKVSLEPDHTKVDTNLCAKFISFHAGENIHARAGEGIKESVLIVIPPAGSSDGNWKLEMVTPGRLLNAFNEIVLFKVMLSKIVPKAVNLNFEVDIVHSKLGLCNK